MYWGKLVGGTLGLMTGRWFLLLLGLVLGHQFDRGLERFARSGTGIRLDPQFIDVCFAVMGHIAKSDGQITENEIRAARKAMHALGLDAKQVKKAIAEFTRGKQPDYPMEREVADFAREARYTPEVRNLFLRLQLEAALAAGPLGRPARARLWQTCKLLGFSRVEFAQLEAILRAQQGFASSAAGRADIGRINAAYAELGVEPTASDKEIKKAYRRLMNRYHPDKLSGSQATQEELDTAGMRTKEIRGAYEQIRRRRGFK